MFGIRDFFLPQRRVTLSEIVMVEPYAQQRDFPEIFENPGTKTKSEVYFTKLIQHYHHAKIIYEWNKLCAEYVGKNTN